MQQLKPDIVYYTGAHGGRDNPEVQAALKIGIPSFPHGQALGELMKGSRQIVAAGSHGKTTTSAMIATILRFANVDPSYAIGCGSITGLGPPGHKGNGAWFVAEGDEYITDPHHDTTPRFLWLVPEILVVTNIDYDHPDAYPTINAVQEAFVLLQKKSGMTIVNFDDPKSAVLKKSDSVTTYGFSPSAEYHISHVGIGRERTFFSLMERGVPVGEFALKVPGIHNVSNAVAAMIAARLTGLNWDTIRRGLLTFQGTKRRFEKLKEKDGITWYDDYAHHPTEISATLTAVRSWYPDSRIIAVFQPHTYSRTKALLAEFSKSFRDADVVLLTDIYASAREHDTLDMEGTTLVTETAKYQKNVIYAKDKYAIQRVLSQTLKDKDIVIFMGAGDIYNWESEIYESF